MKTKSSVFADVSKYGGMTKIKNAYSIIVQYTGKKSEVIKEIVPLPIYLTNRNTTDSDLLDYVKSVIPQAKDITIIYRKLCINQLVKVNGFYYYLGGKTNSKFCIDNAVEVVVSNDRIPYFKVIEKFNNMRKDDKDLKANSISTRTYNNMGTVIIKIDKDKNLDCFDYLMTKFKMPIYQKMKGNKGIELSTTGYALFEKMSLEEQCIYLMEILNLLTNQKTIFDVKALGITASRTTVGSKVSNQEEFKIINESITGLYSNEVTIV